MKSTRVCNAQNTKHAEAKKQIPVLCYHQIREWNGKDPRSARPYIMPPLTFAAQMKMLSDSGYTAILPDQLVKYLTYGTELPAKAILITFDDGTESQYINALPVLNKYGFKASFFIMTVTLDKAGYLSRDQIKRLSEKGHVIGCHTWDHHNVRSYTYKDREGQLVKPTQQLEAITGKPIKYFAYPFGDWSPAAIEQLKRLKYDCAFQLAAKQDINSPIFTIRRIIADGHWTPSQLSAAIQRSF